MYKDTWTIYVLLIIVFCGNNVSALPLGMRIRGEDQQSSREGVLGVKQQQR